ncbi:MAG: peroxiredoxin family protein [Thermoproteota archaeon]
MKYIMARAGKKILNRYTLPVVLILLAAILGSQIRVQDEKTLSEDFSVKTISGSTFIVSANRGKVVMINFMETSCSYCRAQIQELKKVWEKYDDRIVLLSISRSPLVDTEEKLQSFAIANGANWTWARDVVGATAKYHVTGFPSTFIIDQHGYVRYKLVGVVYASTIEQYLNELLNPV